MQTKTELHTHLMGMLSASRLIEFLDKYHYSFPVNEKGKIEFVTQPEPKRIKRIPAKNLIGNKGIIEQLSISHGSKVDYNALNDFYLVRNSLIADLVKMYQIKFPDKDENVVKYVLYSLYLEECLRELIDQEVKYVEISYSNAPIIENAIKYVNPKVFSQIKCKFLLSTGRDKSAKDFRQVAKKSINLLNNQIGVGIDIMGSETPLSDLDLDPNDNMGLKRKLIEAINILHPYKDTTLRIHSGETRYSSENTEKILSILEDVEKDLKIIIPPPEIRIGHGVYFRKSNEYLRLLKKFNCVIEINASSNYALDNIDEYSDIPYNYYLDNDIDVVICSDGHGLYDTTKDIEDDIAQDNIREENKKKVIDFDKIIRKKAGV